jgi:hypothetical protein
VLKKEKRVIGPKNNFKKFKMSKKLYKFNAIIIFLRTFFQSAANPMTFEFTATTPAL